MKMFRNSTKGWKGFKGFLTVSDPRKRISVSFRKDEHRFTKWIIILIVCELIIGWKDFN